MTIRATMIEHSVAPHGVELATMELKYPRVIHAEFMTHRQFSRSASSSRAVPWKRLRKHVIDDPYVPIHWGRNQAGMQAREEICQADIPEATRQWLLARDDAVARADELHKIGVHKQVLNRLIEPWAHIHVVVTSTDDWANFFALRLHPDAMPEIQLLAKRMAAALVASKPVARPGDESSDHQERRWHLPYVTQEERQTVGILDLMRVSAARCARVSYRTEEGVAPDLDADIGLYRRLMGGPIKHAPPSEHQACPFTRADSRSGNFRGWWQHRQVILGESRPDFDWKARLAEYGDREFIV